MEFSIKKTNVKEINSELNSLCVILRPPAKACIDSIQIQTTLSFVLHDKDQSKTISSMQVNELFEYKEMKSKHNASDGKMI
jgi:hypothetical protein